MSSDIVHDPPCSIVRSPTYANTKRTSRENGSTPNAGDARRLEKHRRNSSVVASSPNSAEHSPYTSISWFILERRSLGSIMVWCLCWNTKGGWWSDDDVRPPKVVFCLWWFETRGVFRLWKSFVPVCSAHDRLHAACTVSTTLRVVSREWRSLSLYYSALHR